MRIGNVRERSFASLDLLARGTSNGRHVLVFELARGRPSSQLLRDQGPLAPGQVLRLIYDAAQVLAAEPEMSHGDLRPEKIFFDGQGASLADFGLARASCLGAGFKPKPSTQCSRIPVMSCNVLNGCSVFMAL